MLAKFKPGLWVLVSRVLVFVAFSSCSCHQNQGSPVEQKADPPADSPKKLPGAYIDLKKALLDTNLKTSPISVKYDPFFKTAKEYAGFYLDSIVDPVVRSGGFDTSNTLIVFECGDGYKPVMELSKIYGKTKGYIVFRDLDKHLTKEWADSIYKSFVPYYLVWDDVKKDDNSFMWPYGLMGLRLIRSDLEYKAIYPFKNPELEHGFTLLRENCLKCHSVNKIGGTMGPEFNIPKNITEYWKEADIIAFAKNPASFRYNSHMPPVTGLTDTDMHEIIQYLRFMKNNKVIKN